MTDSYRRYLAASGVEKVERVLEGLDDIVERGVGPQPSDVDEWRRLLHDAMAEVEYNDLSMPCSVCGRGD